MRALMAISIFCLYCWISCKVCTMAEMVGTVVERFCILVLTRCGVRGLQLAFCATLLSLGPGRLVVVQVTWWRCVAS